MKQILRSYALGLLTSTTIIGVYFFYFMNEEPNIVQVAMTEADMISSLEASGYYVYETDPIVNHTIGQEPEEELTEDKNSESDTTEKDDEDNKGNDHDSFVLTIEPGMTISQVADYLMIANLIESKSEFTSYLIDNNYGTNIQVGQFELNREMSLDEVVETIANQSN